MGPGLRRETVGLRGWLNLESERQSRGQVDPAGIVPFNQIDLPLAPPPLDLPFPPQGPFKLIVGFVPNQTIDAVGSGEARHHSVLVLPDALRQISRHSHVERSVEPTR